MSQGPGAGSLRIGCDVQEVAPVGESIERFGRCYLDRILSPEEAAEVSSMSSDRARARAVAEAFAAKESVFKLLGASTDDAISWPDISVRLRGADAPAVRLAGRAAELAARVGIGRVSVSVTSSSGIVSAVAMASEVSPRP